MGINRPVFKPFKSVIQESTPVNQLSEKCDKKCPHKAGCPDPAKTIICLN